MVPIHHRSGTYTPSPAQSIITASSHSPHGSHTGGHSAGLSPSTPTSTNPLTKIVVAQVYLLLSTIKENKHNSSKWEAQAQQLRKLVNDHGMEVFSKYFVRLVVANAPQIFSGAGRPASNSGNYQILVSEMMKVAQDSDQALKIVESIDTANEDIFRDFDLSTFMEHFKMDAMEKTILALGFKLCSRTDLKTKADAILSANFPSFIHILSTPDRHSELSPSFIATIIDRYIQEPPPHFTEQQKSDLALAIEYRYSRTELTNPPVEVWAALYLRYLVYDHNPLIIGMRRVGSAFTSDEDNCSKYLRSMGNVRLDEEQISTAILYSVISRTPQLKVDVLVSSIYREQGGNISWNQVARHFDRKDLRISSEQFLALYSAFKPLAEDGHETGFNIQVLWGGRWQHSETQLSFVNAFCSLGPDQLDATTIPGLQASFSLSEYAQAMPSVQERAQIAVRHPLASMHALEAVFHVALQSAVASDTPEAKRLFQQVVVPNLDVFVVSAFGIPRPWTELATETISSLFERFLFKCDPNYDFVLYSVWHKDRSWLISRLIEVHSRSPLRLPTILEHAIKHNWLYDLLMLNGFGLDLAALAHAHGQLDLDELHQKHAQREGELAEILLSFLNIKAQHEIYSQRNPQEPLQSVMLPVRTVYALLNTLTSIMPKEFLQEQMILQRSCITAYPRLVNYGQGFDRIIDENGREKNSLPIEANERMENHYKRMYSEDVTVRAVVEALRDYKFSENPADQDVFACMIHGLFDEYSLYNTYPLEALKTTAVLFGGIIKAKLLPELPLEVALAMALEAVKENSPDRPMYKFGVEALKQTFERFQEWPTFCNYLLRCPGLQGTDVWARAENVIRDTEQRASHNGDIAGNGHLSANDSVNGSAIQNGNYEDMLSAEPAVAPFKSLHVDPLPHPNPFEAPSDDVQEKVLFVLNNITERNLETKFVELKDVIDDRHQQWFAGHLVEERAKMQPNYHQLYLGLVTLLGKKSLWSEVLRETYASVIKMLNAETTMQSSTERSHLKNLGGWLGSLTLARDKPIRHRNIAFKELLLEAYDSQRLIVVIPFVCKVLTQGASSTIFRPPNPWLMDIIHLLIELYQHADLKLNQRFEIEVLCKALNLDHKSIEPSTDIKERIPPVNEPAEPSVLDAADRFDALSINGIVPGVSSGRFSPQDITASIPDLGPLLVYPPTNDLVNPSRLHDIVRTAITRAVHEIVSPVVERSVTIAALSTAQMIQKDFATEGDENRLRQAAIAMVKKTAGSLALVTSKEPLRASMSNYIREGSLSLGQGLAEGTIIMCVNANLDIACKQVENKAEERAIPEIEELIEGEIDARRRWRQTRGNEPYVAQSLSRWAMTIPPPYKLLPSTHGLNPEQMAIYDDFARNPRLPANVAPTHTTTASDASRSIANDVLQEQFAPMASLSTPAEPPAMPMVNNQLQSYGQLPAPLTNGRAPPGQGIDPRVFAEKMQELLDNFMRVASNSPVQSYDELPRTSDVLHLVDAIISLMIKGTQQSEAAGKFTSEYMLQLLFNPALESELAIQCLVHMLNTLCRLAPFASRQVKISIHGTADERLLNPSVVLALINTEESLLDWQRFDQACAKAIAQHHLPAVDCLSTIIHKTLLLERPTAFYTNFARSFDAVREWLAEDPSVREAGDLVESLRSSGLEASPTLENKSQGIKDQMHYVFDEWINLVGASEISAGITDSFIEQLFERGLLKDDENLWVFLRTCIDTAVDRKEHADRMDLLPSEANLAADAVAILVMHLVKQTAISSGGRDQSKPACFNSLIGFVLLVLNHHYVTRGTHFCQPVFFRLLSTMMHEANAMAQQLPDNEKEEMVTVLSSALMKLQPAKYPGFAFAWLSLISHREFLPLMLSMGESQEPILVQLIESQLVYLGEFVKQLALNQPAKDIYRGVLKVLLVLHHDAPEFLAKNHVRLIAAIPTNAGQLHNLILTAVPAAFSKMPDPMQPGLKIERVEDIRMRPPTSFDSEEPLRSCGLLDLIDQALVKGPSEDAVAHIAHAIQRPKDDRTSIGHLPVHVNLTLVDAIVLHIANHAIEKGIQKNGPFFIQGSTDSALLTMLVHELTPEARLCFLDSMANHLRFPNAHTLYFCQALLDLFGNNMSGQEEMDVQQQITRILLSRLIVPLPQPWGLLVTINELIKNEKYMFYEQPAIKSEPEIIRLMQGITA